MRSEDPLNDVLRPVGRARGLPNEHYTDPKLFREEKEALFFAKWTGIGFAKDVPNEGDVRPVNFLGMPLLMVRDQSGSINVNRHAKVTHLGGL